MLTRSERFCVQAKKGSRMAKYWRYDRVCTKECFANENGQCKALTQAPRGECSFQRSDITMQDQKRDMEYYDSRKSIYV